MNKKDLTHILLIWVTVAQLTSILVGWQTTTSNVWRFKTIPESQAQEAKAQEEYLYHNDPVINYIYKTFGVEEGKSALKVAQCESSLNPEAESNISSASGLYQIIDGTWNLFKCTGDPYNAFDNVNCAKKIFDHTGGWNTSGGWLASFSCHQQL